MEEWQVQSDWWASACSPASLMTSVFGPNVLMFWAQLIGDSLTGWSDTSEVFCRNLLQSEATEAAAPSQPAPYVTHDKPLVSWPPFRASQLHLLSLLFSASFRNKRTLGPLSSSFICTQCLQQIFWGGKLRITGLSVADDSSNKSPQRSELLLVFCTLRHFNKTILLTPDSSIN